MSSKQKTPTTKKDWLIAIGVTAGSLLLVGGLALVMKYMPITPVTKPVSQVKTEVREEITADAILNYVNEERLKAGVERLRMNPLATQAAEQKCKDMVDNNYYEHVNPKTGKHGYEYTIALIPSGTYFNENMTQGAAPTNNAVVQAWMDSPAHKATMLEKRYTDTGIAICQLPSEGENSHTVVQQFVEIKPNTTKSDTKGATAKYNSCNIVTIPPHTRYESASWVSKGQSQTFKGMNGFSYICSGKVISTVSPVDTVIYNGTYEAPTVNSSQPMLESYPTAPPQPTREQQIRSCIQKMQTVAPGSSAYMQCYSL